MKNLLNNHLNIVNIINNDNTLNNSFKEYQINIKENYDKWLENSYKPEIKKIKENIENIEIKLKYWIEIK